MIEAYLIHLAILIAIYIVLAVSLDLALGYTGLLNLGHVAFFGIGAYTSALLTKSGVPFPIAFIAAFAASINVSCDRCAYRCVVRIWVWPRIF